MISMYFMGVSLEIRGAFVAPSYLRVERGDGRSTRVGRILFDFRLRTAKGPPPSQEAAPQQCVWRSDPVVQLVLEGVRALRERLDLLLALVLDPGLDELRGEHAAC